MGRSLARWQQRKRGQIQAATVRHSVLFSSRYVVPWGSSCPWPDPNKRSFREHLFSRLPWPPNMQQNTLRQPRGSQRKRLMLPRSPRSLAQPGPNMPLRRPAEQQAPKCLRLRAVVLPKLGVQRGWVRHSPKPHHHPKTMLHSKQLQGRTFLVEFSWLSIPGCRYSLAPANNLKQVSPHCQFYFVSGSTSCAALRAVDRRFASTRAAMGKRRHEIQSSLPSMERTVSVSR